MSYLQINEIKEEPDFLLVTLGESFSKKVYKKLFISHLRRISPSLSPQEVSLYIGELEVKIAKAEAIRLLSRRSFFTLELREKLEQKALSSSSIAKAIEYCKNYGALDEERKIEYFIEKALEKGKGPAYIKAKLRSRGVEEDVLEKHLRKVRFNESRAILKLLATRLRKFSLKDAQEKRKAVLFLQRRGFSLENIFSALKEST